MTALCHRLEDRWEPMLLCVAEWCCLHWTLHFPQINGHHPISSWVSTIGLHQDSLKKDFESGILGQIFLRPFSNVVIAGGVACIFIKYFVKLDSFSCLFEDGNG